MAGICGTDRALVGGYKGGFHGVLGHEFVGTVEACDDARWVGRRAVAEINWGCGKCARCAGGDSRHCFNRRIIGIVGCNGAFAERVLVPTVNLHEVPESVSDREAVFTEPLAAALAVRDLLTPGSEVLVAGDGPLGTLVALGLLAGGWSVSLSGRHPEKLALIAGLGVPTLGWGESRERRWPAAVDCTGSPEAVDHLAYLLAPHGKLVLKTTGAIVGTLDTNQVVVKELQILGSRCGRFQPALEALADRSIPVEALISRVLPLSDGDIGLLEKKGLKTLLDPNL
jgi:threonine dehydrogenase-like Zn-dependent dehydrogenase